jgi:hypothetical protein
VVVVVGVLVEVVVLLVVDVVLLVLGADVLVVATGVGDPGSTGAAVEVQLAATVTTV